MPVNVYKGDALRGSALPLSSSPLSSSVLITRVPFPSVMGVVATSHRCALVAHPGRYGGAERGQYEFDRLASLSGLKPAPDFGCDITNSAVVT